MEVPHALCGQHEARIQMPLIQAVAALVFDIPKLAEELLLLNGARDLHQCNAGELGPLADLVLGFNGAVDTVPECVAQFLAQAGCL